MKYILEELATKYILSEKYILVEKNRRTEARSLEQGQELIKTYISKFISRVTGHGNYKVLNPEAAGVPTLKDKDLKPDLKHLLTNNENGWLQADENNLSYWAELVAKRLKSEEKLIINDKDKTIQIKTDSTEYTEYTVTFIVDKSSTNIQVKEGEKVTKPADPKKENYNFIGWFTDDKFTTEYDFNETIYSDLKLYAKFEAITDNTSKDEWDWGERYRSSKNKNAFWDLYYEKVWHENDQMFNKVKELGEAFRQELVALGFKEELNPLINFVKKYWKRLTHDSYVAIHDSLVEKNIDKKDIIGQGKLKYNNIIFSKDLYTKSYNKIIEYLELQKEISSLSLTSLVPTDEDGKKILEAAGNSLEKLAFILMFKVPSDTDSINIDESFLDSHENIEVKLLKLDVNVVNKNARINTESLISKINSKDEALLAIIAMTNKFANKATKNNIIKLFKDPSILNEKNSADLLKSNDNATKYFTFINELSEVRSVDNETLLNSIKNVCKAYGIEFKEEK